MKQICQHAIPQGRTWDFMSYFPSSLSFLSPGRLRALSRSKTEFKESSFHSRKEANNARARLLSQGIHHFPWHRAVVKLPKSAEYTDHNVVERNFVGIEAFEGPFRADCSEYHATVDLIHDGYSHQLHNHGTFSTFPSVSNCKKCYIRQTDCSFNTNLMLHERKREVVTQSRLIPVSFETRKNSHCEYKEIACTTIF